MNITIGFEGYWREEDWDEVPKLPGLYCIYAYIPSRSVKHDKIELMNLLYIGTADDVQYRLLQHREGSTGEYFHQMSLKFCHRHKICSSIAIVNYGANDAFSSDLKLAERALIHKYLPPCNSKAEWIEDDIQLVIHGDTGLLHSDVIVSQRMGFLYDFVPRGD